MKKFIVLAVMFALMLASLAFCIAEEEEIMYEFDLDAYSLAGGVLNCTYADGTVEETGSWCICTENATIGELLESWEIVSIEAVNENDDTFEGWIEFEIIITEDEDGFSEYSYIPVNTVPFTTEELMAKPMPEYYAVYAAKWAGVPAEEYYVEEESEEVSIYMPAVTLYADGGTFLMHGEEEDYEGSLNVATMEPGQIVGEVMELDSILSVTCEGKEFAGWTVYEAGALENIEGLPEDEDALYFEVFEGWACVLLDYTVIGESMTTEEIGALVCGEKDLFIVANWE